MRRPIIAGNWKMNKTKSEAIAFVNELKGKELDKSVETIICANITALEELKKLEQESMYIIAQNFNDHESGAYTGETSLDMLKDIGISGSLIGHSERRSYYNETDEVVNTKVKLANEHGFEAIVCVGELLEEREAGKQNDVVKEQVVKAFEGIDVASMKNFVIAYEPVWAIGTGKTASSQDAEDMAAFIRNVIKDLYGDDTASKIRILYGGSVKEANVKDIMAMENIDGALVGGASLKVDSFEKLINYKK